MEGSTTLQLAARLFVGASDCDCRAPPLHEDEDELELMIEAALVGCRLFEHILGFMRPGVREIEVAAELEHQARLLGAEGMSFETIVGFGSAFSPSARPRHNALLPRRGFVTLDFGVILKGYCSDMTRTVFLGKPTAKERGTYQAVLEAQEAAVAAVTAGASCGEVDEAARGSCAEGPGRGIFPSPRATGSGWRFMSRRASAQE